MLRVTAKQQVMREIVDLLSILDNEEAKFRWGEKGLACSSVDVSHVAMLEMMVADECFETYEVDPIDVGMDLRKLGEVLALAGPNDLIELDYDETTSSMIVHVSEVRRTIRGLDTSMIEEVKLPNLDFDGMKVVIPTEKFIRSFRAAKLGGDLVDLSVDASHFAVRSGEPTGESVETKFEAGELGELSVKQPSTSTYSIRFPNELARKINPGATESLEIKFKASYPLKVDWVSNGGGAKWTFLLAPRVTNE